LRAFSDALAGEAVRAHATPGIDMSKISVVLRFSRSLRGLQLVNCDLGDGAMDCLADALNAASDAFGNGLRLESLHLGTNHIGPDGAAALARAIPQSIRLLALEHNVLSDDGAASCATLLEQNSALALLDLSFNHIGDLGVLRLLDGLASNCALEQLDLRGNPYDPAQHAPALEPRFALLEGDAAPVKARVVFE